MSDPEAVAHRGKESTTMEDQEYFGRVKDALSAAMSLVLSDNVYGPNDRRTRGRLAHLEERLNALTLRDREVDIPPLRVVRGGLSEQEQARGGQRDREQPRTPRPPAPDRGGYER
jgi:hypothetical protein